MTQTILTDQQLRVVFEQQVDRLVQRVEYRADPSSEQWQLLLNSIEGTQERWPPSPPFQQLHIEYRAANTQVAFLVGTAGTAHWSASIALQNDELRYDVACKFSSPSKFLGSSYYATPIAAKVIRCQAEAIQRDCLSKFFATESNWTMTPDCELSLMTGTVRWCYEMKLLGN